MIFLLLLLVPIWTWATSYNELYDGDGKLRSHYTTCLNRLGFNVLKPPSRVIEGLILHGPLGDSIKILPVPLVLDEEEYENILAPATRQIGRALVSLFADLAIGSGRAFRKGGFIRRADVDSILRDEQWTLSSLRALWRGKSANAILFRFGPDFVRAHDGSFIPLEVNVGHVGGIADLTAARLSLENTWGRSLVDRSELLGLDEFEELLFHLMDFLEIESRDTLGFTGPLYLPSKDHPTMMSAESKITSMNYLSAAADHEPLRKSILHSKMGLGQLDSLTFNENNFRITSKWTPRLILNEADFDYGNFKLTQFYLNELFRKRNVIFMNAPGTEILANKVWLAYLPQMIRFYLDEEPLTEPPRTRLLNGKFHPVGGDSSIVVKKAASHGGKDIWIVKDDSLDDQYNLQSIQALANRAAITGTLKALYVDQRYVEHSVLPTSWMRYRVDFRPIGQIMGPDHVYVSRIPFCRAAEPGGPLNTNNVSNGAYEVVVLLERKQCEEIF